MLELHANLIVFLSSGTDIDGYILLLAAVGPITAVAFFRRMHKKYRNFDVTHNFEAETIIHGENMKKSDSFVRDRKNTTESHVAKRNSDNHRTRVQEF